MLAQGDLAGLLNWQLQDNVKLLDTFYMFWHKAYGRWDFCDDNAAVWEKEIRQFFGDEWRPGKPASTFLEIELQGERYYVEIIVGRHLAADGCIFGADTLEPSRFHQAFAGVDLPIHYEWARFSTQPFTEKLTPLKELRRVAASLAEHLQICSSRGFTCSICKATGGVERQQVMSFELTRGEGLLPKAEKITCIAPIELPMCPVCETRHCQACADACAARQAATEAAEAQTRATQQLNDQARNQKQQRKALQPALVQPQAPPEDVAGPDAPEPTLSKRAQRRRDKQAKQRQAALRLENKANEKEEEENRKVRKQVERLKLTEDTTVQQSLEALDSVKELVAAPFKEGTEKRARPAQPPLAAELEQRLLESTQRGAQMRAMAEAFVASYSGPGLAPADASAFSEHLVQKVLRGRSRASGGAYDTVAAATVFGDFADAFCSHQWVEPCLRVGRHVIIGAAAAAERPSHEHSFSEV